MAIIKDSDKINKMIVLKRDPEDRFPFRFGRNKAKLLVENFEAVKKFAEEEGED